MELQEKYLLVWKSLLKKMKIPHSLLWGTKPSFEKN